MRNKIMTLTMLVFVGACGRGQASQSSLKIVGGQEATADDEVTRHTVALVTESGGTFCSGTLIKPDVVMTAAHCIHGVQERFSVGFGLVTEGDGLSAERKRALAAIVVNKNYLTGMESPVIEAAAARNGTASSDIALLVLKEAAPAGYKPVRVLNSRHEVPKGALAVLAGYGLTTMPPDMIRRRLQLEKALEEKHPESEVDRRETTNTQLVVDQEGTPLNSAGAPGEPDLSNEEVLKLLEKLKNFKPDVGTLRHTVSAVRMFTGASELILFSGAEKGVCSGDSGGPAYLKRAMPDADGNSLLAVGIASRSDCERIGFYTDVRKFDSWLKDAEVKGRAFAQDPAAFIKPGENLDNQIIVLAM